MATFPISCALRAWSISPPPPPFAHPKPAAHEAEPQYLGTFKNAKSLVEGDIFRLDDHTIYIQGFSFDGHAPNAVFWSDGIEIPYYTRKAKLEPFLKSECE